MSKTDWRNLGSPKIDNHNTRKLAQALKDLYREEPSGGKLKPIVEDWNLEDKYLNDCQNELRRSFEDMDDGTARVQQRCLDALFLCSYLQRASGIALANGYWTNYKNF